MLRLLLPSVLLPLSLMAGHDPAKLNVHVTDEKWLSFEMQGLLNEGITRYQVAVDFSDTGLGCSLTATVKTPQDLHTPATCGIPTDPTGKPIKWKARIVFVEFASGLTWKPKE